MKIKNPYVSWSAIFSGAIVGVGLNFLLNLLSLGIGAASFSIQKGGQTVFSLGGFLFFCLSALIAMSTTGWVAGRLTVSELSKWWGIFFGFLAWSMLLIFTIILITNMIQYSAFHSNFTSNLVAIKLVHDAPMLTETAAQHMNSYPLSINIELKQKIIVLNAFLTFILFLIGAFSSCIGGFVGYKSRLTLIKD